MHIERWVEWMALKGMSPDTIRRRRITLRQLKRYVAPLELDRVPGDMIETWLARWPHPATRHAYLNDVRCYYQWAVPRGASPADPTVRIGKIKVPDTLPRPIDDATYAALLASCGDSRVRTALMLAGMAGLRRGEICALDWTDINLEARPPTLIVRNGKGGKDRTVPIHSTLVAELGPARRTGPVVATFDGRPMSRGYLGTLVKQAMSDAGIVGGIHRGRHRFGSVAYHQSQDLLAVADLMGHASTKTTSVYVALSPVRGAQIIEAMPPIRKGA